MPASAVAAHRVRLHPGADRDLEEGLAFYSARSPIAAERSLSDVEAALDLIAEAPDRWPLHRAGTRRHVLSAFPYSIVYRVGTGAIEVFAVAHAKRQPLYWARRHF